MTGGEAPESDGEPRGRAADQALAGQIERLRAGRPELQRRLTRYRQQREAYEAKRRADAEERSATARSSADGLGYE